MTRVGPGIRRVIGLALLLPLAADAPAHGSFQKGNPAESPEVRVAEPFPEDLVVPMEPLPSVSEDLEPLPKGPRASAEQTLVDAATVEAGGLLATIGQWAEAWASGEVELYLSFYADTFELPEGMSRGDWEGQRRERLLAPSFIEISIEEPAVVDLNSSLGQVEFVQRYTSDRYSDVVRKTLHLIRSGTKWQIVREQAEILAEPQDLVGNGAD